MNPAHGHRPEFGRRPREADLGIQRHLHFVVNAEGGIVWQGPRGRVPKALFPLISKEENLEGETHLPAFVDAHTHAIFAGSRQAEFELRNAGKTYQEIAQAGGGIQSTVKATRSASKKALAVSLLERIRRHLKQGVGVMEIKSGYGLAWEEEAKLLRIVQEVQSQTPVRLVPTYLGPHAPSPEHEHLDSYLQQILDHDLPALARLGVGRADMFVESGYFSEVHARAYVARCRELGLDVALHAEQLTDSGTCLWASQIPVRSVDHCVRVSDQGIAALSRSPTVAVLLPIADLYIHIPYPPARKLLDAGVQVALATDFNPGSAPSQDLSLMGVLARLEMKMSLPEVLFAMTWNGATALGLENTWGRLAPGRGLSVVSFADDWTELFYRVGYHPVSGVTLQGRNYFDSSEIFLKK